MKFRKMMINFESYGEVKERERENFCFDLMIYCEVVFFVKEEGVIYS